MSDTKPYTVPEAERLRAYPRRARDDDRFLATAKALEAAEAGGAVSTVTCDACKQTLIPKICCSGCVAALRAELAKRDEALRLCVAALEDEMGYACAWCDRTHYQHYEHCIGQKALAAARALVKP